MKAGSKFVIFSDFVNTSTSFFRLQNMIALSIYLMLDHSAKCFTFDPRFIFNVRKKLADSFGSGSSEIQ